MKKYHYLIAVALVASTTSTSLAVQKKGGETGNGGTIIIDGDTYRLSDLDFIATPAKPLTLDQSLINTIVENGTALSAGTYLTSFGADFVSRVLNPLIEYRFVGALPTECALIESGVGCAQGSITFLAVKQFEALSLEEKAETLLEVRANAISNDPAINKAYADAVHGLVLKYKSEATTVPFVVRYTDEELAGINKVIDLNPPTQTYGHQWYRVVQGGGRVMQNLTYGTPPPVPTISITDSTVDVKSTITVTTGPVILNHSVVSESQLVASDLDLDNVEIINMNEGSYQPQPIHLKNQIVQGQARQGAE